MTRKAWVTAKPITAGPMWQRNKRGRFVLPRRTLGWTILGWTAEYLLQPDGAGPNDPAPQPLREVAKALKVPWWAPTHNAVDYMFRLGALSVAIDELRQLADIQDWGEPTMGDRPATDWVEGRHA